MTLLEKNNWWGYSKNSKNWIAQLIGRNKVYKFKRDFIQVVTYDNEYYAELEENQAYEIKHTYYSNSGKPLNIALKMYHPCHSFYHCLPRFLPHIAWLCTKTINISYILNMHASE